MIATLIAEAVAGIIDKIIPDANQALAAKTKLDELYASGELNVLNEQAKVVMAEMQTKGWLANNWRALLMTMFGFIIFNNLVIVPYAQALGVPIPSLTFPPEMWQALMIGMGGYIAIPATQKAVSGLSKIAQRIFKR